MLEIGPVSVDTLRPEDLIPTFAGVLKRENAEMHDTIATEYADVFEALNTEDGDPDPEQLGYLLDALVEALNEIALPYTYFGSTDGDGACFGFWAAIESLEDNARYKDGVIKVNAGDEWPVIESGIDYVMSVSDHGNVTLYNAHDRTEIWSVV